MADRIKMSEKDEPLVLELERPPYTVLRHARELRDWCESVIVVTSLLEQKMRLETIVDQLERRVHDKTLELQRLEERLRTSKQEFVNVR